MPIFTYILSIFLLVVPISLAQYRDPPLSAKVNFHDFGGTGCNENDKKAWVDSRSRGITIMNIPGMVARPGVTKTCTYMVDMTDIKGYQFTVWNASFQGKVDLNQGQTGRWSWKVAFDSHPSDGVRNSIVLIVSTFVLISHA
jgi:hypothetical protein